MHWRLGAGRVHDAPIFTVPHPARAL